MTEEPQLKGGAGAARPQQGGPTLSQEREPATYISNAFSLSMLASRKTIVIVEEINVDRAKEIIGSTNSLVSAVGHEATAKFLSYLLGVEVPYSRVAITLQPGDYLIVLQLLQRLPEGKILGEDELKNIGYKLYLVTVSTNE